MNIVILHRIPFRKIRYDLAAEAAGGGHTLRYLCPAGGGDDLPADAERRFLDVATGDTDAVAALHADWLSSADRLIARSEYDLLPAARLRERFGIPGDRPPDVLPLRDKWLMRTLAGRAGVPQPAFWSVEDFRAAPPQDGQYLVKPRRGASSTGIERDDPAGILARLADGRDVSGLFVEEFVPGEIWHLDGVVSAGEPTAVVSSAYVGDCLTYAYGGPLGSAQRPDDPEALALLRRTITVLGQREGAFHFEAIRTAAGRFLFLETAARVGGAGVAETYALRTGVDLYQADLRREWTGVAGPVAPRLSEDFFGWFVFPAHHRPDAPPPRFEPERYGDRLVSYVRNERPAAHPGRISYATVATPLSGMVRGTADGVRATLEDIHTRTEAVEQS